jgi:phage terminase small subunit
LKKKQWKTKIKKAAIDAGTYQPFFDAVIDTLAGILERRDDAEEVFKDQGKELVVEHTNKGGATNREQNPIVRMINDLNRDALAYWRDLGLTPAGFKRLNDMSVKPKEELSALEKALNGISKELGKGP